MFQEVVLAVELLPSISRKAADPEIWQCVVQEGFSIHRKEESVIGEAKQA